MDISAVVHLPCTEALKVVNPSEVFCYHLHYSFFSYIIIFKDTQCEEHNNRVYEDHIIHHNQNLAIQFISYFIYIYFNTDNYIWSSAVCTGPDPKAFENSLC